MRYRNEPLVTPLAAQAWIAVLVIILGLAGGVRVAAEPIDRIVAIVDDDVVMQSEFDRFKERILQQMSQREGQMPPEDIINRQVLERLVMAKIQLQYAKRAGVTVDDDTLNKAVASVAAQNKLSLEQFREVLAKEGYDYAQYREDIRNEITLARLKQREVDNRVTVSDREVDSYLQNPRNQGTAGDTEYRISHILIATPEGATPDQIAAAQREAEEVREQIRNGADFAKLAAEHSDSQQALEGGDVGWRKAGEVPSVMADALRNMKAGEVSEVMRGPSGFHIIKLADVRTKDSHMVTQTHARHILVKTSEAVSQDDARRKLEQLKTRLDGGDDFAALARSHSEDRGSAANGGDLGWINPGEMDPDFENAMKALEPNQISEPFQTQFGWHIVQVLERREHDDSAEAQRAKARETIRQRKIEEELQAWMRRLRDEAYVEYRMPGVAVTRVEEPGKAATEPASPAATEEPSAEATPASPAATEEPAAETAPASPAAAEEPATETAPAASDAQQIPATEPAGSEEGSPYVVGDPGAP
ncbi:MAG: Chaperone SurA [Gammaproteobacteria bacterium]|nr:Chaperone SurA [Gammaproteobacteria bacterium]